MKALLCKHNPPPSLSFPRTRTNLHSQTNPRILISEKPNRLRCIKLQANPKGFTAKPKEPSRKPEKPPGSDPDDPPIPQEVFEKMMGRIVVSVGAPLAVGVAILKLLGMLKDQNVWDVPMWVPFCSTILTFGTSALGIVYGSLSTSLDPNKKGSLLGLEEARHNWTEMWKQD